MLRTSLSFVLAQADNDVLGLLWLVGKVVFENASRPSSIARLCVLNVALIWSSSASTRSSKCAPKSSHCNAGPCRFHRRGGSSSCARCGLWALVGHSRHHLVETTCKYNTFVRLEGPRTRVSSQFATLQSSGYSILVANSATSSIHEPCTLLEV